MSRDSSEDHSVFQSLSRCEAMQMSRLMGDTLVDAYEKGFNRVLQMMADGTSLDGQFIPDIQKDMESIGVVNFHMSQIKLGIDS